MSFDRSMDLVELAELVDAEQSCCSFFTFSLGVTPDRVWLDVTGPEDARRHHLGLRGGRMTELKTVLVGAACLICCPPSSPSPEPPLVSSAPGGRYDLAIVGALGLVMVIVLAVRRNRTAPATTVETDRG